jgi:PadR family transcriptional regulator, regulatory protein PadR
MPQPRMTLPTQRVLRVLLSAADEERYGMQVAEAAGLPTGTVHPILARLERLGWLESRWEDVDPRREGRPARRYYRLTEAGAEQAQDALARVYRPTPFDAARLRPLWEER